MTEPETILSVSGLSVSFRDETGWNRVIKGISFHLNKGETLGIVGESGSGKSVTSLSVMRLLPAKISRIDGGNILFYPSAGDVKDITRMSEPEMQQLRGDDIAMIFQEPMTSLNPVMRCGEQVMEAIRLHLNYDEEKARNYVLELFEEVMLPDPARAFRAYPHELSGGQKQRVMIAMAISCRPAILIADEPTTALDVTVQKTILQLLRSLQEKYGMSLIFISHDLGVISEIASRVLVMKHGEIVEQGDVQQVFQYPVHPYTQGLIACRPPLDRRLRRLPTVSDFEGLTPDELPEARKRLWQVVHPNEREEEHRRLYAQEPILRVDRLTVAYPLPKKLFQRERNYFKAVDGVSFDVYPGETLGLVGESGCGKTTLGRAILQLIEPAAGKVFFKGEEVTAAQAARLRELRQRMQIIFQDPYSSLNPRFTAGQAILEPMEVHGVLDSNATRRDRVIELLEQVNLLPDHFNRYPHQFSGGQRQRICIARALALNPEFVICDESVSALDVSVQAQVLNLLNDLKARHRFTYIFISHDLSVVRHMSDRIFVMKNGRFVEHGEADELYNTPREIYTRTLIDAIPGVRENPVN